MIKLRNLLEGRERSNCWLAPDGRIIPVDQTHDTTARRLMNTRISTPRNYDPMMELWKKGYQRVTWMNDGSLYVNNEIHPPTPKQMIVLKQLAQEGAHTKIEFDNGEDLKVLWTTQDILENQSVV